ncbi:MetQ/NlpA family ABC transporter substrate-binding protein [Actinomyces provencensis]|uniref:MetQ/NlpA family ABC transporter substrate-binding protein n=1 Tax=Actinomyces provencensis TaxID=1720198 RepID=UPI00096A276C|nr:MetQ/NlpA family ABC transporter substrate-binding protein [Actinomyces provencensis]
MRSFRSFAALGAVAALALAGCSGGGSSESGDAASGAAESGDAVGTVTLTVGASPSPHAKILQFVQDNLAASAGLDLDIVEYSDYIQPNVALADGDLDANYFQTVPYLENYEKENGGDFVAGEGIHLEPLGLFSSKIKDLADFPDGGTIGIIADTTNQSRALALLADNGFVELPSSGDANVNTVKKLKDFEFKEVDGPQLVRALEDVDLAAINGNYAQEGGLSLSADALAVESATDNPSVNVLVWNKDASGEKLAAIQKLEELLHSDDVRTFIEQTWTDGSVIPAF